MTYEDMQKNLESLQSKIRDLQIKIGRNSIDEGLNNNNNEKPSVLNRQNKHQ